MTCTRSVSRAARDTTSQTRKVSAGSEQAAERAAGKGGEACLGVEQAGADHEGQEIEEPKSADRRRRERQVGEAAVIRRLGLPDFHKLSYPFPIADPATCVTFAEACVPFIEKSAGRGGWTAGPAGLGPHGMRTLAIPVAARIGRPIKPPCRFFCGKAVSVPAKWLNSRCFCPAICGAWVTVGRSTDLAMD